MSTRGILGFRLNGKDYLTYNHSDSYPSGLGQDFVREVKELIKLKTLAAKARKVKLVTNEMLPTPEDIEKLAPFTSVDVGSQSSSDWYCLLRGTQGSLKATLKCGYMQEYGDFIKDSLFCEYAYILNLDTNKVEFYEGFNKDRGAAGRYAALERKPHKEGSEKPEYCGVKLVGEFSAKRIPKDWEAQAFPQTEE